MLQFNNKTKELYKKQNPKQIELLKSAMLEYQKALRDNYMSFYKDPKIKQVLKSYVMDTLVALEENGVYIEVVDISIEMCPRTGGMYSRGRSNIEVGARITYKRQVNGVREETLQTDLIPIISVPFISQNLIYNRQSTKYTFDLRLINRKALSFYEDSIRMTFEDNYSIAFKKLKRGVECYLNGSNSSSFDTLAMCSYISRNYSGKERQEAYNNIQTLFDIKVDDLYVDNLRDKEIKTKARNFKGFGEFLNNLDITKQREELSRTFNIYRLLGLTLAEDILDFKKDEILTYAKLNVLHKAKVKCVKTFKQIEDVRYLVNKDLIIFDLHKGTKYIPEIMEQFKSSLTIKEGIIVKDVKLNTPLTIAPNTVITGDISNFISSHHDLKDKEVYYISESSAKRLLTSNISIHFMSYDKGGRITINDALALSSILKEVLNGDLSKEYSINHADLYFNRRLKMPAESLLQIIMMDWDTPLKLEHRKKIFNSKIKDKSSFTTDNLTTVFESHKNITEQVRDTMMKVVDLNSIPSYYNTITKVNLIENSRSATGTMRQSPNNSMNRICGIQTPQSNMAGLSLQITLGTRIDKDGELLVPYFPIKHNGNISSIDFSSVVYLTSIEDLNYKIAAFDSFNNIDVDTGKILEDNNNNITVQVYDKYSISRSRLVEKPIKDVDYVTALTTQSISTLIGLIPFSPYNDSVRNAFSGNMLCQTKALLRSDKPRVYTNTAKYLARGNTLYETLSKSDGIIKNITGKGSELTLVRDADGMIESYRLATTTVAEDTIDFKEILVKVGDHVKAGDILCSSTMLKDRTISGGQNALIAYLCTSGNYEDALTISKSFANKVKGLSIYKDVFSLPNKVVKSKYKVTTNKRRYLKVGDISLKVISPALNKPKPFEVKKGGGFVVDFNSNLASKERIQRYLNITDIKDGAKFINRHANKGTIESPQEDSDMPILNNGMNIDYVPNPLGVPSRMNIGQVIEAHSSLVAEVLDIYIVSDSYNGFTVPEISYLMELTSDLTNAKTQVEYEVIVNQADTSLVPKELKEHIISKYDRVTSWANTFDASGNADVYCRFCSSKLSSKATIGYNYVYLTNHDPGKKLQGRGGIEKEFYNLANNMPPQGIRKRGGQKLGAMELNALVSYGADEVIYDAVNVRGDNMVKRVEAFNQHLNPDIQVSKENVRASRRRGTEAIQNTLNSIGFDFVNIDSSDEFDNILTSEEDVIKARTAVISLEEPKDEDDIAESDQGASKTLTKGAFLDLFK